MDLHAEVATLKEKVRVIEESDSSLIKRFIGKIEDNRSQIQILRDEYVNMKNTLENHIEWSGQISINYEKLHSKVENLETLVRKGFQDLSLKVTGQDRDFNYFVRIPAKTVIIGALGVIGVIFGHTIIKIIQHTSTYIAHLFDKFMTVKTSIY